MPPKDKALEEMRRRLEDMGALRLWCKKLIDSPMFCILSKHEPIWCHDPEEPEMMQENLDDMRKGLIDCYEIICEMWDILTEGQ